MTIAVLLAAPTLSFAGVKEDLQGIRQQINEKSALLKKTRQTETKVSSELEQIQRSLKEKQQSLAVLGRDLNAVESGIGKTTTEIDRVKADVERKRVQINKRLAALYKSGDTGNLRVYFSSQSFPQLSENLRYMRGVLDNDRRLFAQYNADMDRLRQLKDKLEQDATRKTGIKRSIEARKREVEQEKARKAGYLAKVRQDKQSYQASLSELQANEKRLQLMFARLEAKQRKAALEAKKREQEAKKREAQEAKKKAQLDAKSKKGSSPRDKSASATESASVAPAPAPTPPVPDSGLGRQKGKLSLPVRGTVTARYGRQKHPEFNSFTVNNGISIAAGAGTPIHAVYDGEVIFADYFKGYGNMVIVDHGGGFYSLYAHASSIAKKVGSRVSKNDVLASVGDVDSSRGPMLYFEIRYQGKPVDPSPWFR